MFGILIGFLPWILYFMFSDPEHVLVGTGLALVTFVLTGWKGLAQRKILDWVTLLFFLLMLAAIGLGERQMVARYGFVASGAALTLTAFGSLLAGVPFTLQYARDSVPEEHQNSPIFLRINEILSAVWGTSFLLQTGLSVANLEKIGDASLMNEVLPNALTAFSIIFTSRFPDWYSRRELGKGGVASLPEISPLKQVDFPGGSAAYRTLGQGPPLLMLCGSHMTMHGWDTELLAGLSLDRTLYLFDYPGVGGSRCPAPESVERLADWLEGALDALELPQVEILGYSMGGCLGQTLAARSDGRVRALVLIAIDPGGSEAQSGDEEALRALSDESGTEMEQAYRKMGVLFPPEVMPRVGPKLGDIYRAASLEPDITREVIAWEDALAERWYSDDAASRISALRLPMLVFMAELDVIVPVTNVALFRRHLPHAILHQVPGAGHGLPFQEPEFLIREIRSFLGSVEGAAGRKI